VHMGLTGILHYIVYWNIFTILVVSYMASGAILFGGGGKGEGRQTA